MRRELGNAERLNQKFNAFTLVFSGSKGLALSRAREIDGRLRETRGRRRFGPLMGVPVALKDNLFFGGFPTTNGSEVFRDFVPQYNAEVVDSLLEAGCVPIGKANLHEMALGITGTSGHGGPIRNPVDPSRISGGSSGGSAVSVALAEGPMVAIGTDTGGSVRLPAALCGVCGFKPSQGVISTVGVFPLSPSLDHVGMFTKTLSEMKTVFQVITGSNRGTPRPRKVSRIGVPDAYFTDDMDGMVSRDFERTLSMVRENSRTRVEEVRLEEDMPRFSRARGTITIKEGSWFYEGVLRSPGSRRLVHPDVLSLLDKGLSTSDAQYLRSLGVRAEAVTAFSALLSRGLDALAMPTSLVVAPRIQETVGKETGQIRSLLLRNTELFNFCGLPALSIPMNADKRGELPTAIQLVGRAGADLDLLELGGRVWDSLYTRERNQ